MPNRIYKFIYLQLFNVRYKFVHLQLLDVNFLFLENRIFRKQKRTTVYRHSSLVLDFKLIRENDDLLSSRHKQVLFHKISVNLILSFPSLTHLTSVELNPQSFSSFAQEVERMSSCNRQATRNIILRYIFDTVKKFKDAGSLHTDQYNTSVISPVVNSSFEAGQKMIKLEITHMMS